MTSAGRSQDVVENKIKDVAILEDMFSATSTSCTSCSYISYNMKINNTQLYIEPIQGHTHDCLEHGTATNANIGSISVQNATDVTFGNKTFFNGPVVIKQLVVDYGEPNADPPKSSKKDTQAKTPLHRRILRSFRLHPRLICSFIATIAVIVITLVITAYFLNLLGEPSTCIEIPSQPSHYSCGYASGCTRCKAIFPDKEICESFYEPDCGNLRCFCKPECKALDCRPDNVFQLS